MAYESIRGRQSFVSASGRAWENYVRRFLNSSFIKAKSDLVVLDGRTIGRTLWNKLAIKVNGGQSVEGDIDLVVISKRRPSDPLAVISCKTSLHGRFSETLFYAVIWKLGIKNFVVVFATPDKGRQAQEGKWESEWGSDSKPTKDRQLAERFLDGVYVKNNRTLFGGKIKPLDKLPKDLMAWL